MKVCNLFFLVFFLVSCGEITDNAGYYHDSTFTVSADTTANKPSLNETDSAVTDVPVLPKTADTASIAISTNNATPASIVAFAKTMLGTPYKFASTDPAEGFDCSGFITYVFNHFNISVPRSSVDFTNVGREVPINRAKAGDLILFTGTDSSDRTVGHMGIVVDNTDSLRFIHSSSGKAYGVIITPLNNYYKGRFVKVIDVF